VVAQAMNRRKALFFIFPDGLQILVFGYLIIGFQASLPSTPTHAKPPKTSENYLVCTTRKGACQ
jgi:hypothetical protein